MDISLIMTGLPQYLQSAIYLVSTSLLYPVIIILLGLTVWLVIEIGMFSFEWFARSGRFKKERGISEKGIKNRMKRFLRFFSKRKPKELEWGVLEAKLLINKGEFNEGVDVLEDCTSKRFIYHFLDRLVVIKDQETELNNPEPVLGDIFSINLEKSLQKLEIMIAKQLERTKVVIRLGPMFGLMGTLIPMGPALLALTTGDVNTLANNLIIAFGTTVIGLLVGGLAYLLYTVRTRWYKHDMIDIQYICEVLFGGE
ncbi:MAG: MotA/TolQ/ExbB proton channel family protein [Candidatus Syntrophoarchaeum sp. GoM_oil]|nr:MAG: MotA/TolQ/ExbB proton channel family protein [Candidatus Syntrophoarchaeum sp. GoM_oil]